MSEQKNKLLEVKDLKVSFFTPAGEVKAVGGISYDLDYGEVMGVVGESGSGKSQEAYSIMGLLQSPGKVVGGSITFEGQDVLSFTKDQMTEFRGSKVAMIFQNPMTCLKNLCECEAFVQASLYRGRYKLQFIPCPVTNRNNSHNNTLSRNSRLNNNNMKSVPVYFVLSNVLSN